MTFTRLRTRNIPAMQAEVQEYEHPETGARHIHLASDSPEMVFLVGFPTVPDASDGRAHILEHLALCGSERYPVRDPFFAMLRRSTAHFMNAMTYADKTVYPFASTSRADFFNLLDVYLDAAFFPRLDYLDFLQEGWRLTLENGQLVYQGVVFNEMKGAFADPVRALDAGIAAHLLRGTTYAFESGGDPLHIPELTHAALKEFHATHYHPSQAVFMTAGGVDPFEVQQIIEERVLSRLTGRMPRLLPELAPTWETPESATIAIPAQQHGVQIAWLLGETVDQNAYYDAALLEAGLLSNAAAPLMHAMESAGFGRPSTLNGLDSGGRQMVFHLGMEGLSKTQVAKARSLIWAALEKTAKEGVPGAILRATLRDMRFRQREIIGGSTPYALRRLLRAMPHEMYGGDIMNGFDNDAILDELQQKIEDPAWFKAQVRQLLDNSTRLDATVEPDAAYFDKRKQAEEQRLAALQASLTEEEKERLRAEAQALLERQRQPANNEVLPRIRPQDVEALPRLALELHKTSDTVLAVAIPSNGISYARVMYDVSGMDENDWPWLQLYAELVPDLGCGNRNYDEADAWRHERVPYFDVNLYTAQVQDESRSLSVFMDFYVKGLREEGEAMAEVLSETLRGVRFDEHQRLIFLIDSRMKDLRDDLAEQGDDYAQLAATAPLSAQRRLDEHVRGTAWLGFFRDLHKQAQAGADGIAAIAKRLEDLHLRIIRCKPLIFTAGDAEDSQALAARIELPCLSVHSAKPAPFKVKPLANTAVHAAAQVNHCIAVWPVPACGHPDAPVLAVLAELLTNLVLHQALREEGGAYGGYAAYNESAGMFMMKSYRDPRLAETYAAFEHALGWLKDAELKQENIEEAIICVVQNLDKPRTPYGELMWSWELQQQGITEEMRRNFRHGVLNCTAARLKEVSAAWLLGKPASRAAFVGDLQQDLAGLEPLHLMALAS